jgi:hypothetical protein
MGVQAAREIADVYGATCLAAGCGSVVMLVGARVEHTARAGHATKKTA